MASPVAPQPSIGNPPNFPYVVFDNKIAPRINPDAQGAGGDQRPAAGQLWPRRA